MERDLSLQPGLEAVIQQSSPPPNSYYQQIPGTSQYVVPEKAHDPYASNYPGPPEGGPPSTSASPQERKILGLRVVTFILVCIIIALIIVGAVGGGVAGNAAVNNAKNACLSNPSPTTSAPGGMITSPPPTSATNSIFYGFNTASAVTTVWGPEATVLPYTGCPGNNQTIYTSLQSVNQAAKFKILCGMNIPWSAKSDILGVNSNSLQLCIEACGSWNNLGVSASGGNSNIVCAGVAFVPDWTNGDPISNTPNNCFLKSNQTTDQLTVAPGTHSGILIS